jgi:hypothetical protein
MRHCHSRLYHFTLSKVDQHCEWVTGLVLSFLRWLLIHALAPWRKLAQQPQYAPQGSIHVMTWFAPNNSLAPLAHMSTLPMKAITEIFSMWMYACKVRLPLTIWAFTFTRAHKRAFSSMHCNIHLYDRKDHTHSHWCSIGSSNLRPYDYHTSSHGIA